MVESFPPNPNPDPEQIAALAQRIYEEEGCPEGRAEDHWLQAEQILRYAATSFSSEPTVPPVEASREDFR